jgi:hypothetical protein
LSTTRRHHIPLVVMLLAGLVLVAALFNPGFAVAVGVFADVVTVWRSSS